MKLYFQCCAAILLAVILILMLGNRGKEYGLLLALFACGLAGIVLLQFLKPILDFVMQIEQMGNLDDTVTTILLKAVGVGLISEIVSLICNDSGSGSLGKLIQMLGSAVVLWLSLPLFTMLFELIQRIFGGL